ncbi:hypothetical protein C1H46_027803 [Malus baccata]|uniref:Uncharacterized protein n=1 Tax=Malus baccata TaxID=106549 RepID=A0A540LJN0_MALBA|nr:hypothetical protein C1H46_027803 [Malus baccata]
MHPSLSPFLLYSHSPSPFHAQQQSPSLPSLPFLPFTLNNSRIGPTIICKLQALGFTNLVHRTHAELDLTRQADIEKPS